MGRTIAELESSMSSSELLEWLEYFQLEPLSADRNEIQMARLTMATVGGKNMKFKDFMVCQELKPTNKSLENRVKAIFGGDL